MDGDHTSTGLRQVLDSVALGVFAVDRDWRITFFNREAERITGYTAAEAMGMQCRDVFGSQRCAKRCYLRKAMQSGKNVIKVRLEILNRCKRRIPLEITAAVLRDENGAVLGGVESILDLTARQVLEKHVRQSYRFSDMVGRAPAMRRLFETVKVVASTNVTVLLQGETGTGKDLLARIVHNLGQRASGPFIKVNCAAIPANLFESELFGYRKGAFTDAKTDRPGLFARAEGGTIFLDEVGDIPLESQAKLLQVLDEGTYLPLGAMEPETVDVRLLAATNRNLATKVDSGEFRSDLYYRLRVVELHLPLLRERHGDIPLLLDHFLGEFSATLGKHFEGFTPQALQVLLKHDYPGNVRELRHVVEHGAILASEEVIRARDLPPYLTHHQAGALAKTGAPQDSTLGERDELRRVLEAHGWRTAEVAQALGIHRSTLWRRRRKLGL